MCLRALRLRSEMLECWNAGMLEKFPQCPCIERNALNRLERLDSGLALSGFFHSSQSIIDQIEVPTTEICTASKTKKSKKLESEALVVAGQLPHPTYLVHSFSITVW